MFSGIGGFELGIQNAFERSRLLQRVNNGLRKTSDKLGKLPSEPLCVGYSEIDKYAIKVYERQFGSESNNQPKATGLQAKDDSTSSNRDKGHINYGDATKINAAELPDFDLLVGGFPCQAFSVAGKRAGFNDTRGTLFFDIARILAEKRPRHLVLENVKGLLSHDSGKTFQTILGVLSDLGYRVEWQVLNSKSFGVPQNRERVFFVGHLRGECGSKVFPIGSTNSQDIIQLNQPKHSNDRVYSDEGLSPTLNTMQGGNRQPFVKRQFLRYLDRNQKNIEGDYSFTVDASQTSGVKIDTRIRRLTPLECERLQGFPDNWTKFGEDEHGMRVDISDSQRYKMAGNAVTVNTVQAVITKLFDEC